MDIHIIRDGTETGPFTEESVQTLLKEGRVLVTDLAWRPGMSQWLPLMEALYPAAVRTGLVSQDLPAPSVQEPASDRQKAFLSFLSIPLPSGITREQAAQMVVEATENSKHASRLAKWNTDRFRLYPELFAEELHERKENRPQHYFEASQNEGAEFFSDLTKAHCQVLVGFLDVKFPNWDADARAAVWDYFFPAVADKFPQLVTKAARGRFKYPEGPKVAAELIQSSPETRHEKPSTSPLTATLRGLSFGAVVLLGLWLGRGWMENREANAALELADLPTSQVSTDAKSEVQPANPKKKKNLIAAAPTPTLKVAKVEPVVVPSVEPVAASAPAATPAASDLPVASPGTTVANDLIPPSPIRTTLTLTKPVEFQLPYGRIQVPAGTTVKLLQQSGNLVRVGYLDQTALIPASSTDLGTDPVPSVPSKATASSVTASMPVAPPSDL